MKTTRLLILGLLVTQALTSTACESIKSRFARQTLPDLGPPIALTVQMDVDPSLAKAKTQYIDGCSRIQLLSIGPTVEDLLVQAAHQTFRTVLIPGGNVTAPNPDVTVRVRMLDPQLKIQADGLYDRKPAELSLDVVAEFYDAAGKRLAERPLQATRKERLQLELTQQRCDYLMDPMVQDTSTMLATQFMQEARVLLDPVKKASATSVAPAGTVSKSAGLPPAGPATAMSALSFKATLLDENSNLLLEGGERIRVRVDVVNTGPQAVQDIAVQLAGPPTLITQFPATKLSTGTIEAGGSKSLEFIATLPQSLHPQQAEFQVSVASGTGLSVPPPQTLLASVLPTGLRSDDVDQIPAVTAGFQRSGDYLLSIGLSSYREQHIAARKYAALDAEMVAAYFQSLGGLPRNNIRLLQDWSALRPDIEEALLDWLPSKITKDSVVMVYFAGQAIVSPAGETFLIPYDGALDATTRLYPLKDLESALGRLKAKQVLFVFDGTVLKNGAAGRTKVSSPKWSEANESVLHLIATTGFGKSLESDTLRHGLFTYYFLRGLRGEADLNRNGEVTIGEMTAYVNRKVPMVARSDFKQEQQPQVLPAPRTSDRSLDMILTKPPVIPAAEHP
ncbi:MAG: caspase family protein [Nitrospira defluvii]|nr:caspase family protein [Nitrospira defluvii]